MKNILLLSSFVAALAASAPRANANPSSANANEAQVVQTLAATGQVAVASVGDYVQAGTYRIWVSGHLGRPDHVLADGTWLYDNRRVEQSTVGGTLAISFVNGQVSAMRLLSPATATALLRSVKPASLLVTAR